MKGKMESKQFVLQVEVGGRPIREFGACGRTYVEGRVRTIFTLKFKNNTASRVMVIPSIDGLSVMDGKEASKLSGGGYVVPGLSSIEIKGWRTSLNETRQFEFSNKPASYAGKTTGEANCGVIGCLVYAEKVVPRAKTVIEHHHHHHQRKPDIFPAPFTKPWWLQYETICSSDDVAHPPLTSENSDMMRLLRSAEPTGVYTASVNSMLSSTAPDYNLGTKFGEAQVDNVHYVDFEIGRKLDLLEIYYTDAAGLSKAGVDVNKTPAVAVHPQSFSGFCQPPPE